MNKVSLITGGSSGIGRALALVLAEKGMQVYIVGRHQERLLEVRTHNPNKIHPIVADITTNSGRESITHLLVQTQLDYLIHNAAIIGPLTTLNKITIDEWRQCFSTNVEAPLFLTQKLLTNLKKGSRILHLSSGLAHHSLPGVGAYACSKAALHMLYLTWKEELSAHGILVGSIMPGVVDTEMQSTLRQSNNDTFPSAHIFQSFASEKKLMSPETVAKAIRWMLINMDDQQYQSKDWNVNDCFWIDSP